MTKSRKILGLIWLAIVLSLAISTYHALVKEGQIKVDLLGMLPSNHSPNIAAAQEFLADSGVTNRVLLLIGHTNQQTCKIAMADLRQGIQSLALPFEEQTTTQLSESYTQFFKHLYPHRAGVLSEEDRALLIAGKSEILINNALSNIVTPIGVVNLTGDPFSFYSHFVQNQKSPTTLHIDDKGDTFMEKDHKYWYIYTGVLKASPFSLDVQQTISEKLMPFLRELQQRNQVDILKTGAVFYAMAGSEGAKREISVIGLLSTLGIILMIFVTFRTIRPLVFAISVIGTAMVTGLAACLFFFGSIHLMALVFGCSLVGITVDYALHYTCASYKEGIGQTQVMKTLCPALPLSVLSSAAGYGLLLFMPFPGIQQMALLASTGLIAAFMSVYLWGPMLISPRKNRVLGIKIQSCLETFSNLGHRLHTHKIVLIGLVGMAFLGGWNLSFDDNLKSFQALNRPLKQEEDLIKSIMPVDTSGNFLNVRGSSLENALQQEEAIISELIKQGISYQSLSMIIPSQHRQRENQQLVSAFYETHLKTLEKAIGQEISTSVPTLGAKEPFFTTVPDPLPIGYQGLMRRSESGDVTLRILLKSPVESTAMQGLSLKFPNVHYVDVVGEYSSLFGYYRQIIMGLLLIIFCGIFGLLAIKSGIKAASQIMKPVVLSILATIGILSFIGFVNLFHVMGLLLVLCIGLDYALFLYWRVDKNDLLLLGNALAATTTILSFGLLSFSETRAVYSFGMSVFIGILLCFCVTTLIGSRKKASNTLALILFCFSFTGCASPNHQPQVNSLPQNAETIPLAEGVFINKTWPSIQSGSYLQNIKATFQDQEQIFSVSLTLEANKIDFIAFNDMIGRLYQVTWTPTAITSEASDQVPQMVQPENMIGDFLLVHLPTDQLKTALAGADVIENGPDRSIMHNGKIIRKIRREGAMGPLWKKVEIHNPLLGYTLTIETVPIT